MKKIISVILSVVLLISIISCMSLTVSAKTYTSGDYEYETNNDGTATITKYNGYGTIIKLPEKLGNLSVTGIGEYAFQRCFIYNITIPDSVKLIGSHAFYKCDSLQKVTFGKGITNINNGAFDSCTSLTSIVIPNKVTSIDDNVFMNCSSLSNVTIPNGVKHIGEYSFANCTNLAEITIPNGVTSIGQHAFVCCSNLTSINIPESVTEIGTYAFYGSGLMSISIPDGVTSIADCAFYDCPDLITASIPEDFDINVHNIFPEHTKIEYRKTSKYSILFNANGGSGAPDKLTANVRQASFTVPNTIPVRVGYTFEGWSEYENGSAEYLPGNTYTIDKSITLYAVWKAAKTYTIKYDLCGGTGDFPNQIKTEGINLKLYSNRPTKAQNTFAYWLSSDQVTKYYEGDIYKSDASDTLYAVWKETCPICHGSQYSSIITCTSCDGKGSSSVTYTCITCKGTGKTISYKNEKCERCNGSGTISGYGIDTYGNWQWMTIACPHCDGKGSNRIEVSVNCSNCSGCGTVTYQRTCSVCDGEGAFKTKCAKCDGKGSIYHYPRFNSINYTIGDSNYDGIIDVLDATMVQKFAVEKTALTEDQKEIADVNDDGVVDILDASDIQKFAVEKITEFKKK